MLERLKTLRIKNRKKKTLFFAVLMNHEIFNLKSIKNTTKGIPKRCKLFHNFEKSLIKI